MEPVARGLEPNTHAALLEMAGHVAEQLVASALRDMVAGVRGPVTVTIHPQTPTPALLGDGKPVKRAYVKRAKPKVKAKPKPKSMAAKRAAVEAVGGYASTPLAERACRNCTQRGTAVRVVGTERTVKCSACGHAWDVRGLPSGVTSTRETPAPRRADAGKGCRCTHQRRDHVEYSGVCTARGCSCPAFTAA